MNFWDTIRHFTPIEFTSPNEMDRGLITLLDYIRADAGVPICITSSFRDGDDGAHGEGLAVDISDNREGRTISSRWRHKILRSIYTSTDISRVGIYDLHIHLDLSQTRDQEVCWIGTSR